MGFGGRAFFGEIFENRAIGAPIAMTVARQMTKRVRHRLQLMRLLFEIAHMGQRDRFDV